MEISNEVPVLETILSSYTQEVFPSISLDEISIDFKLETDRNLYLDMRDTHSSIKFQLFKGRLFEAFKNKSITSSKIGGRFRRVTTNLLHLCKQSTTFSLLQL